MDSRTENIKVKRFPLFKIKDKLRHGTGVLAMTIGAAIITACIAAALAKMNQTVFTSSTATQLRMQAEQYAQDRASILRSCNFDSLASMPKREVGVAYLGTDNQVTLYEEVVQNPALDDSYKELEVDIYRGDEEKPITSVIVKRTNPGYLLDGQLIDEGNSESSTLTSSKSQNVVNSRFSEGSDSDSTINAMSTYAAMKYTQNKMIDYVVADESVKVGSKTAAGDGFRPVYVDSDGNVMAGKVSYRLQKNLDTDKLAVLVKEGGKYYIDYLKKEDFFANNNIDN